MSHCYSIIHLTGNIAQVNIIIAERYKACPLFSPFYGQSHPNPKFNVVKSINTDNILYVKEVLIGFHFIGNT